MLYKVKFHFLLFSRDSSRVCGELKSAIKETFSSSFIAQSKLLIELLLHSLNFILKIMKSAFTQLQAAIKLGFAATTAKLVNVIRAMDENRNKKKNLCNNRTFQVSVSSDLSVA